MTDDPNVERAEMRITGRGRIRHPKGHRLGYKESKLNRAARKAPREWPMYVAGGPAEVVDYGDGLRVLEPTWTRVS